MAGPAKDLSALLKQLIVRQKARADIDTVNAVDADLRSRNGTEVLAAGYDCPGDAAPVGIRNSLHQGVRREYGYAQAPYPVGLDRESALAGHSLDDGLHLRPGLHGLVRGQVADVAGTYREDALSQQGEFRVHHPLDHRCSVHARQVVVLEGRHEGKGSRGHHKRICLNVKDFLRGDILHCQAFPLQDIPDYAVQDNSFLGVSGKVFGYVEPAHAAQLLFLLEEEELVRLHPELTAHGAVVVDDQIVHPGLVQLFPDRQAGRPGADDSHRRPVHLLGCRILRGRLNLGKRVDSDAFHLLDTVHRRDADTADVPVHEHLAGAALADAALHGAPAAFQAVMVDRKARLVQRSRDGLPFLTIDGLSFKKESVQILAWNGEDRMSCNLVHYVVFFKLAVSNIIILFNSWRGRAQKSRLV